MQRNYIWDATWVNGLNMKAIGNKSTLIYYFILIINRVRQSGGECLRYTSCWNGAFWVPNK